jgi:hypothetical protein
MGTQQLALAYDEPLDLAANEPLLYHDPERYGFTSIFQPGAKPRQVSVRLKDLPGFIKEQCLGGTDQYIAQNEFSKPNRQVVNCSRLTSCCVDLDTYKLDALYGQPAEALADRLLRQCDDVSLPPPSIVVYSGRGLQAKWLLERPTPRSALPRWQALQAELGRRLLPMGADLRALDASRVLRLVGSVNSRSGHVVRPVHLQRVPTFGSTIGSRGVAVYPFDSFFDDVMPWARQELTELRSRYEALANEFTRQHPLPPEGYKPTGSLQSVDSGRLSSARRIIPSELAWARLADLRKLAELRHGIGGLPSGQRNLFVFLGACFLASALVTPRFRTEVQELAKEFAPSWSQRELADCIHSVHRRLEAASRGLAVDIHGQRLDTRYRFKNSTLVEWLGITSSEMPHMKAILSVDEARERDRVRKQAERRSSGSMPRETYLQAGADKAAAARALQADGRSLTQIAETLGISRTSASRYCRQQV